jgi:restriction endonuclease S subunit
LEEKIFKIALSFHEITESQDEQIQKLFKRYFTRLLRLQKTVNKNG